MTTAIKQGSPDIETGPAGRLPMSDTPTFGVTLRELRQGKGLTQVLTAKKVRVSRATLAQWEGDVHLPGHDKAAVLDDVLDAGGRLVDLADQARGRGRRRATTKPRPDALPPSQATPPLGAVFAEARQALLDQLVRDERGNPVGWRHALVKSEEGPTILSTMYGLNAYVQLGGLATHLPTVVDRIVRAGYEWDPGGKRGALVGWRSTTQVAPRLEATGQGVAALVNSFQPLDTDQVITLIASQIDAFARQRPFVLTAGLEPVLTLKPDCDTADELVTALLETRIEVAGGIKLWPEKKLTHRDQPMLEPSLAHTARAVTVLRKSLDPRAVQAVEDAEDWLVDQANFDGVGELLRRGDGPDREDTTIFHFTAALQAQALAGSPHPNRRRIRDALAVVWERYDPTHHLWVWGNGDPYPWMTRDAAGALRAAAVALAPGAPAA